MFAILVFPFLRKIHFIYVMSFSVCPAVTAPPARGDPHIQLCYASAAPGVKSDRFRVSQMRFMGVDTAEHSGLSCKYICSELLK